jgi:ABC-type multidrug transport system fused ATPase/permease subunit
MTKQLWRCGNSFGDLQMSAVERMDDQNPLIALPHDTTAIAAVSNSPSSVQKAISAAPKDDKSAHGERLRPLLAVAPYLARYRVKALAALVALTVASLATLVVPVAVQRMSDFGFTADSVSMINSYFSLMIVVVAVLALASASRLYLVTTLGERIVADLRRDVFSHLTSLSPAFFDSASSGELVSRLTADTTQIKAAVVVSISTALRNLMLFAGASTMMVVSSARLSVTVIAVIPLIVLPLVAFGRKVRTFEILRLKPAIAAPASPAALPTPSRGDVKFRNVRFAYPTRPGTDVVDSISFAVKAGESCHRRPVGCGQKHVVSFAVAFLRPQQGHNFVRWS